MYIFRYLFVILPFDCSNYLFICSSLRILWDIIWCLYGNGRYLWIKLVLYWFIMKPIIWIWRVLLGVQIVACWFSFLVSLIRLIVGSFSFEIWIMYRLRQHWAWYRVLQLICLVITSLLNHTPVVSLFWSLNRWFILLVFTKCVRTPCLQTFELNNCHWFQVFGS